MLKSIQKIDKEMLSEDVTKAKSIARSKSDASLSTTAHTTLSIEHNDKSLLSLNLDQTNNELISNKNEISARDLLANTSRIHAEVANSQLEEIRKDFLDNDEIDKLQIELY